MEYQYPLVRTAALLTMAAEGLGAPSLGAALGTERSGRWWVGALAVAAAASGAATGLPAAMALRDLLCPHDRLIGDHAVAPLGHRPAYR